MALSLCGVSLFTSTAISVERLFALVLGLRYRQTITRKRVRAFVIFSWLGISSNAVVYLYGYRILLSTASAIMLLCISTSTFCYVKIYRIFRHHQFQVQERIYLSRPNRKQVPINIARYRKTVSSALWISLELLVCYLPFVIMIFIEYITYSPIFALFFWVSNNSCLVELITESIAVLPENQRRKASSERCCQRVFLLPKLVLMQRSLHWPDLPDHRSHIKVGLRAGGFFLIEKIRFHQH